MKLSKLITMSMESIATMADTIWNLATGNTQFMENTHQYPERLIAPYVNIAMRAAISIMWLFLYGSMFDVHYKNGDFVRMFWCNFKYKPLLLNTHNGIWASATGHFILPAKL